MPGLSLTGPSGSTRNSPDYPATSNFPDYPATRNLPDYPANTNFPDYPANTNFPDYPAITDTRLKLTPETVQGLSTKTKTY